MNFDLIVSDVMTTRLITSSPQEHILDAIDRLLQFGISGSPVVSTEARFLGMLSEKSALRAFSVLDEERRRRCDATFQHIRARDFMTRNLVTIRPDTDVFDAIDLLLERGISGIPVTDADGEYLGVFSERSAMRVVIDLTWEQLSGGPVSAWMDQDRARIVTEYTGLDEIRAMFRGTHYRRLAVLNRGQLVGQISRRDVLRVELDQLLHCYEDNAASVQLPEWAAPIPRTQWLVENFMKTDTRCIAPGTDLLTVAQDFFLTSARRFPVTDDGGLVGQVSRRDLLRAVRHLFPEEPAPPQPLFLSSTSLEASDVLG